MTRRWLGRPAIFWLAVLFEGGLGVLAWSVGGWLSAPPLATLRWEPHSVLVGVAASLPMLVGFALCVRWPIGPLARIKDFSDTVIRPLFAGCSWLELGLISLAAGCGEEMLFRGLLQLAFTNLGGLILGVLAANLLFGLMHLITPTYAVLAFLLGVYLSGVWLLDGNILSVVVAHALYDFVALGYLVRWQRSGVA